MWYLDYEYNQESKFIQIELTVKSGLFLDYVQNKLTKFPVFINTKHAWYKLNCPYWIELDSETPSKDERLLLMVNKPIRIPIPDMNPNREHTFIDNVVDVLLSWIEEEHKLYQREWKLSAGY
jgi:hypothetical protein